MNRLQDWPKRRLNTRNDAWMEGWIALAGIVEVALAIFAGAFEGFAEGALEPGCCSFGGQRKPPASWMLGREGNRPRALVCLQREGFFERRRRAQA